MPNFTVELNNQNQVYSLRAASRADYIQMVHDYASGAEYQDQYDLDTFAEALIDAGEEWMEYYEHEKLFMDLGLA